MKLLPFVVKKKLTTKDHEVSTKAHDVKLFQNIFLDFKSTKQS